MMRLDDRIEKMVEALPDGASVTLTVETLRGWLEDTGPRGFEPDLTVQEVADLFKRSPVTVRAWIRTGQMRAYRFRNKEWRIPPSALEEFSRAQRGEVKQ